MELAEMRQNIIAVIQDDDERDPREQLSAQELADAILDAIDARSLARGKQYCSNCANWTLGLCSQDGALIVRDDAPACGDFVSRL